MKTLEKDGIEIIESKQEQINLYDINTVITTPTTNNNNNDMELESQSLSYFNEEIICPHKNLLPGQNKRLISQKIWSVIFEKYFSELNIKVFTNESRECKLCQVMQLIF